MPDIALFLPNDRVVRRRMIIPVDPGEGAVENKTQRGGAGAGGGGRRAEEEGKLCQLHSAVLRKPRRTSSLLSHPESSLARR